MTERGERALKSVEGLRQALEQVADALASPGLPALLAGEEAIERALAEVPVAADLPQFERVSMRREVERARAALLRCRRLGAALNAYVRVTLETQGRMSGYGRGNNAAPTFAGRSVNARA